MTEEIQPFESATKRKRGRPAGSKNKPKREPAPLFPPRDFERLCPPGTVPKADYRYADPATLVARQFSLIDWAQQALRNRMMQYEAGVHVDDRDIKQITELSNSLARNLEGLKKHSDLADEMKNRMSPEELFEAALKKIEGQDLPTLRNVIRRLRFYASKMAPESPEDKMALGDVRATDAIASLGDD